MKRSVIGLAPAAVLETQAAQFLIMDYTRRPACRKGIDARPGAVDGETPWVLQPCLIELDVIMSAGLDRFGRRQPPVSRERQRRPRRAPLPLPKDVGVIDLMCGLPISEDNSEWYQSFRPLLMDAESRHLFKMPAQYTFKDIPTVGPLDDKVGWLLAQLDRFNIERAMIGFDARNPEIGRAISGYRDRFLLDLPVDPNGGMEEVRRIRAAKRDHGINAVSCFPAGLNPQVPINDKRLYPIYATCVEEALPIFVCTGICGPRIPSLCQKVELIEEVVWFFPELTFVMRHGAEPWVDMAVKLMVKFPNLYYSTSAFSPKYYPAEIIHFANTRGADRILYAGYFPMGLSLERIFAELENLPLREEVWPKFLRGNALRLFGLA
jgi:uncharacterized protein